MNPTKKLLLTVFCAVLVFAIIACSCSSLIPTGGGSTTEAIPGLAGKWQDPETKDVHTIVWQNNGYVVTSTISPDGTNYPVTSQSWSNNVLTWTYSVPGGAKVSFTVVSVSGDSLSTTWSNDQNSSGTETLSRVP